MRRRIRHSSGIAVNLEETMEDTAHRGILAVWNDRVADIADFYEWWYVKQHLPERVGLPGWRFGRRYELLDADGSSPQFHLVRVGQRRSVSERGIPSTTE